MRVFTGADDLLSSVGERVGVSGWLVIDQKRIDAFADVARDHQWIHVDRERAATGPFGGTIAHGMLTLCLAVPSMANEVYRIDGRRMGVNYGLNKVRFPAPLPVDSRIRARVTLAAAEEREPSVIQVTWNVTVEREGGDKPVCVAEVLGLVYFDHEGR